MLDNPGPLYDAAGREVVGDDGRARRDIKAGEPLYLARGLDPAPQLVMFSALDPAAPGKSFTTLTWRELVNQTIAEYERNSQDELRRLHALGRYRHYRTPAEWAALEVRYNGPVLTPAEAAELDAMMAKPPASAIAAFLTRRYESIQEALLADAGTGAFNPRGERLTLTCADEVFDLGPIQLPPPAAPVGDAEPVYVVAGRCTCPLTAGCTCAVGQAELAREREGRGP